MKEHDNSLSRNIAIVVAGIVFAALWAAYAGSSYNGTEIAGTASNIIFFLINSVVFMAIFFLINFICSKNTTLVEKLPLKWVGYLCIIAIWIFLLLTYINENSIWPEDSAAVYIRQNIPHVLYILIVVLGYLLYETVSVSVKSSVRIMLGVLLAVLTGIFSYVPNALYDNMGYIFHYDAYTHSIFTVLQGFPYSDVCGSIYGHYALLYYPLVKLLGGGTLGVAKAIAAVSAITILAGELVIAKLIKNDKAYFVAALALPSSFVMMYLQGIYAQLAPHRLVFPALLICYVVFTKDKADKLATYILGWLICVLSIVWNTEMGVFTAISYVFYYIYRRYLASDGRFNLRFWASVVINAAACIVSFGLAIGFVDIFNLIMGGSPLALSTFLYPLLSDAYMNDILIAAVPTGVSVYVLIMILFLAGGCAAFIRRGANELDSIIFFLSVFGMAQMIYYINRPAYRNLDICAIELICLLGMHADMLLDDSLDKKSVRICLSRSMQLVLFVLALSTVAYTGTGMRIKIQSSWKVQDLYDQAAQLIAEVPEDTIAFGQGIDVVLGAYGRVSNIGTYDSEDFLRQEDLDNLIEIVEEEGSFLVHNSALENRLVSWDHSDWTIVGTYDVCGCVYYYMVKN